MGRVSRFKKVKSVFRFDKNTPVGAVWGFGDSGRKPKKRSAIAQALRKKKLKKGKRETGVVQDGGFDLPPQGEDDFTLSDMTVRKQKPKNLDEGLLEHQQSLAGTSMRCVIPDTEREAAKVARLLKINEKKEKKAATPGGRMEGESKGAFNRRVKIETRQIIKREADGRQNFAKRQRKKEFLNNKKKKKRRTIDDNDDHFVATHEETGTFGNDFVTAERAVAAAASQVIFGEQVERPPVFQQLPRGARPKTTANVNKKASSAVMSDSQIKAEHKTMEIMRRKVQAQYSLIKAKRKKAGDFHL